MGKDYSMLSFGRYLQSIRLEKRMNLEDISAETRIGIETLHMIEKEDHSGLPSEVFVKGFLRAYAKAVGADGDEAVRRYASNREDIQEEVKIDLNLEDPNPKFWLRLGLALTSFAILVAVCLFVISLPEKDVSSGEGSHGSAAGKSQAVLTGAKTPKTDPAFPAGKARAPGPGKSYLETQERRAGSAISKKLFLKIVTVKKTWLKVIADNNHATEYSLLPGDNLSLEAERGFNLLVGNAAGIRLFLNDKPMKVVGGDGQVVNIQLP
ncbi:conserved hypothetical protein [Candidatus Desulfarcum epimagneticum]|uniref:Cytoskeleton protein RodZ-like C-terminal domain-containing protein n=1 Tax=uncultured Desulfobacteraceae bacterium TaxID=218296 RepID=A0A484HKU3_9BACT|nr:conserved hypothetical protein [uncultured Desulfobacteraceae bacterium]